MALDNMTKVAGAKRLLVISDIHGHKQGLMWLLQEARYNPDYDRLLLLGDYIDADNPVSWDTLDIIRELVEQGAEAIPGNQELKLASISKRSRRGSVPSKLRHYAKWIHTLPLYIVAEQYLFVHAGIRPGLPLTQQTVRDLTEIREPFFTFPANELASIIDNDDSNHPEPSWRKIMFGHTPTFKLGAVPGEIWRDDRRVGIDTGSKHGYRLTLLEVDSFTAYSCATEPGYRSSDFLVKSGI